MGGCSAASGGGGCPGGGDELRRPPEPPTGPGLTPAARLPSPLRVGSRGLVRAGSCHGAVACGPRAADARARPGGPGEHAGRGAPEWGGGRGHFSFSLGGGGGGAAGLQLRGLAGAGAPKFGGEGQCLRRALLRFPVLGTVRPCSARIVWLGL